METSSLGGHTCSGRSSPPFFFFLVKAKVFTFVKTLKIQINVRLIKGNFIVLRKIKKICTEYLMNEIKLRLWS